MTSASPASGFASLMPHFLFPAVFLYFFSPGRLGKTLFRSKSGSFFLRRILPVRYPPLLVARFLDRPNRFVAHVELGDVRETVHVCNTGRCRELLIPGCPVHLCPSSSPGRKTAFDLVAVTRQDGSIVNIDSRAPNRLMAEWLAGQDFDLIRPEQIFGSSRLDFYLEKQGQKIFLEVKGCTLEVDGQGYFPDAPTSRGARHLMELAAAAEAGHRAAVAFVIQMNGVDSVLPHARRDPAFAAAWDHAREKGVEFWMMLCRVEAQEIVITDRRILS